MPAPRLCVKLSCTAAKTDTAGQGTHSFPAFAFFKHFHALLGDDKQIGWRGYPRNFGGAGQTAVTTRTIESQAR